ncbi:MAG TPA: SDR family NAD(P)-dependent oxidoreductase, partial [Longimicrobium sp.]
MSIDTLNDAALAGATLAERVRAAAELLESIADDRGLLAALDADERQRLLQAAGQVSRPDAIDRRRLLKATKRERKANRVNRVESVLGETGIRRLRREAVFTTPSLFAPADFEQSDVTGEGHFREALEPQNCYICKRDFSALHHFYDQLCPECAEFNYAKRGELADLTGRVALLTGGRVKIGYQAGIKLLRAGAQLIVTTRFPRDSAARYAREPDFAEWGHRLEIFGLDLRHTPSVEAFCRELIATRPRLDFIINNACQTVRRPPEFYHHMMEGETAAMDSLPARGGLPETAGLTHAAELSQIRLLPEEMEARQALFPVGKLDQDLQQVDLRERNSWRLMMAEVPSVE